MTDPVTTPPENEPTPDESAARPSADPAAPARPGRGTVARWIAIAAGALVALVIAVIAGWQAAPVLTDAWRDATESDSTPQTDSASDGQWYISGMHPWIVSPEPGYCPICGMELTPLDPNQLSSQIAIDPTMIQNIGLTTVTVTQGPITQSVRTVGNVTYAEDAVRSVNLRTAGWVQQLYVDHQGQRVEQGQPLLTLYSPELVAAQREYLVATRAAEASQRTGNVLGNPADAQRLLDASRRRLKYLGLSEEQIASLADADQAAPVDDARDTPGAPAADTVQDTITVHSPHTGVVTSKAVNEGQRVEPGTQLFQIANLDTVWVMATLYEQHLSAVQEGMAARVNVPQLPDQTYEGTVAQIYPYMAEVGRSAQVRVELPNPEGLLRPGMFATVRFQSQREDAEAVTLAPREAVLVTGERAVAFVVHGRGEFEPRDVRIGRTTADGMVHIIEGLQPGEAVVTNGIFLLDSETRTREGLARMMGGSGDAPQREPAADSPAMGATSAAESADAARWLDVTADQQGLIDRVFTAYFEAGDSLAANDAQAAAHAMARLHDVAAEADASYPVAVGASLAQMAAAADVDASQATLETLRSRIEAITQEATALAQVAPPTQAVAPAVFRTYCPMVKKHWLQDAPAIANLYDPGMLRCGEVVEQFPTRPAVPADSTQPGGHGGTP